MTPIVLSRISMSTAIAVLLVACGTEGSQPLATDGAQSSTTVTQAPTTTTLATTTTALAMPDDPFSVELGMEPPVPIEAPARFATRDQLIPLIEGIGESPYSRARVRSGWVGGADEESSMMKTITFYDGLTIWDYPGGYREVDAGNGDLVVQAEDGTWRASDRFEWTVPDLFWDWSIAQEYAGGAVTSGDPVLVDHAEIAGVQTAHYKTGPLVDGFWEDTVTDVWVDSHGVLLRMVLTMNSPELAEPAYIFWNVESLDPVLQGPLPPREVE